MKKHLFLLAFAAATFLPAVTALAADLDPPPPPVEQLRPASYDWTGLYVGGWVGMTCIDSTVTNTTTSLDYLNAGCGFKGGALAGYNYQIDNMVLGFEGDWGMSGNIVSNTQVGADFEYEMNDIATARLRLGYAMDDTLFFVTGGGAWARATLTDNVSTTATELQADHWGWTVGGGVEHAVTDRLRVKMDYLYTKFQDADYTDACCDIHGGPGVDQEVRVGAIFAF